ncbi:MAG: transcriptional regulator [Limnochordales bacterium]|nr:transcriptional regulator [Limnochordales bacterium]
MQAGAVRAEVPTWVFRLVERELYEYPISKQAVADYERDRQEILLASWHPEIPVDGGRLPDPTQRKATLLALHHMTYLKRKRIVDAIESVMRTLPADDQNLVRIRYWDHPDWDVETVARELVMSRSEFYRRRAHIVRLFAIRMGLV